MTRLGFGSMPLGSHSCFSGIPEFTAWKREACPRSCFCWLNSFSFLLQLINFRFFMTHFKQEFVFFFLRLQCYVYSDCYPRAVQSGVLIRFRSIYIHCSLSGLLTPRGIDLYEILECGKCCCTRHIYRRPVSEDMKSFQVAFGK